MKPFIVIIILLALFAGSGAIASNNEEKLQRNPYDYAVRKELVSSYQADGNYAAAYYHAVWLTWLAPRKYADSEYGSSFLRTRANRERAARTRNQTLTVVMTALEAKRMLYNTCLNGAIASQATRLRRDITDLLTRAEKETAQKDDPLVRLALAQLGLSLDEALMFEQDKQTESKTRLTVLRAAAARAEAVTASLPESPGAHHTLAIIRGRLASLDNRAALWELAISEAHQAHLLDQSDASIVELLWTLHLRAGHWEQAKLWGERLAVLLSECNAD